MSRIYILSLALLLLFSSCSTTLLIVDNNPKAEIYMNGKYLGNGQAEIKRNGRPKKATFETKYNGEITGKHITKRKFTLVTALVGIYTYGIGFIFLWQFPNEIHLPCDTPYVKEKKSSDTISPWDQSPGKKKSGWD